LVVVVVVVVRDVVSEPRDLWDCRINDEWRRGGRKRIY
jgi:hypothetical protein